MAILVALSLITVVVLYFTNRRKIALKMLKIVAVVTLIFIAFILLTKPALGI